MVSLLLETCVFPAFNFLCPLLQPLPESGVGHLSPECLRPPMCPLLCSHSGLLTVVHLPSDTELKCLSLS